MISSELSPAPCSRCGYNGVGYYQPEIHPCAARPAEPADYTLNRGLVSQFLQDMKIKPAEPCQVAANDIAEDNERLRDRLNVRGEQ